MNKLVEWKAFVNTYGIKSPDFYIWGFSISSRSIMKVVFVTVIERFFWIMNLPLPRYQGSLKGHHYNRSAISSKAFTIFQLWKFRSENPHVFRIAKSTTLREFRILVQETPLSLKILKWVLLFPQQNCIRLSWQSTPVTVLKQLSINLPNKV